MGLKQILQDKLRRAKRRRERNRSYEADLKQRIQAVQRKEYAKERIIQAGKQARRKARVVSRPRRRREGYYDRPISPVLNQLMFGSPQQRNKLLDI